MQLGGYFADNPFRFNDDMIIMPLQAATQWDALSHVYYEDKLYNGFPADSVTSLGAFHCGIDKVDVKGITSRGVLLDLVRHRGAEVFLRARATRSPQTNSTTSCRTQGVTIERGDIVLVRTGWWARFLHDRRRREPCSGLDWTLRLVAARPRGRRRRGRQPAWSRTRYRESRAPSCRCTCCACATWA